MLDFLIKNGVERIIEETRDHLYKIRPLQEFNFYENGVDRGSGVREKSKQLIELLSSNENIRDEREKARALRSKFVGISNGGRGAHMGSYDPRGHDSGRYDSGNSGRYGNDSYGNRSGFGPDSRSGFDSGGRSSYGDDRRSGFDDRPERYGDERPPVSRGTSQSNVSPFNERQTSFAEKNRGSAWRDAEPEEPVRGTYARPPEPRSNLSPRAAKPSSHSSAGGKLKVQIKKAGASGVQSSENAQGDLFSSGSGPDLFNDDGFASQPAARADLEFDAFPSTAQPQQPADLFSQPAASQPASAQSFDPFGAGDPFSAPRAPPQDLFAAPQQPLPPMPPAPQPFPQQQQPQYGFEAPPFKPAGADFMGLSAAPATQFTSAPPQNPTTNLSSASGQQFGVPQQPWSGQPSQPPSGVQYHPDPMAAASHTVAQTSTSTATAKPKSAWGGLVDLDQISKNDAGKPPAATLNTGSQSSFSGLDGFHKGPQPGVSQPIGMAQPNYPRPMLGQPYAMGQQPIISPRPMGQYGMGQPPITGSVPMNSPPMMMGPRNQPPAMGQQPMMGQQQGMGVPPRGYPSF